MTDLLLDGLYIGEPRELPNPRAPWTSSFGRTAAPGRLRLTTLGPPADATFDTQAHGGPDRALLAYPSAHYALWRVEYPAHPFVEPAFAENLRVAGLDESTVSIGDVWALGSARLQVTMPRWPCAKIATYNGLPDLLGRVFESGRIGWLLRVLEVGEIGTGDAITVLERPGAEWTVARAYQLYFALRAGKDVEVEAARALAAAPGLATSWRENIEQKLAALQR